MGQRCKQRAVLFVSLSRGMTGSERDELANGAFRRSSRAARFQLFVRERFVRAASTCVQRTHLHRALPRYLFAHRANDRFRTRSLVASMCLSLSLTHHSAGGAAAGRARADGDCGGAGGD